MRFDARIETPVGLIDGVNTVFTLSKPFTGEPVVFVNGVSKRKDFDDGWTHDGVQTITLKQVPTIGDQIQVWFVPTPTITG